MPQKNTWSMAAKIQCSRVFITVILNCYMSTPGNNVWSTLSSIILDMFLQNYAFTLPCLRSKWRAILTGRGSEVWQSIRAYSWMLVCLEQGTASCSTICTHSVHVFYQWTAQDPRSCIMLITQHNICTHLKEHRMQAANTAGALKDMAWGILATSTCASSINLEGKLTKNIPAPSSDRGSMAGTDGPAPQRLPPIRRVSTTAPATY